jgi:hypothetical protein
MHRRKLEKSAEADQLVLCLLTCQPDPNSSKFDQGLALPDAFSSPFSSHDSTVQEVAPNVAILHQAMKIVEVEWLDQPVFRSPRCHLFILSMWLTFAANLGAPK